MSLAALNSPSLVAAAGAGILALLPYLENTVNAGLISWPVLKGANLVAFSINVLAVSRPGRIDGAEQVQRYDTGSGDSEIEQMSPGRNGRTLVAPAGWAFAIWGPIFVGELGFAVGQLFLSESSSLTPLIKEMTAPFVIANTMQALWTAAFRPKYKGNLMFISAAMLSGTAFSLSKVHAAVTALPHAYSSVQYFLYFLPTSLHFGWVTAASLVNLNGAVAMKDTASPKLVAWLGHVSVLAASAAGVIITLERSAPVFGGVISWALFAVADGMKRRLKQTAKDDDDRIGVYGAKLQQRLSTLGAFASGAASVFVAKSMFAPQTQ